MRKAYLNETSGKNPNVPVQLYDTHLNERFDIGDKIVYTDPSQWDLIGEVVGFSAEDRLLVQWPDHIGQVDASDVHKLSESRYSVDRLRLTNADYRTASSKKRVALDLSSWNPWSEKNVTKRTQKGIIKEHGGGNSFSAQTKFNLFLDPKVRGFLARYGLSENEIKNYAYLREIQLKRLRETQEKNKGRIDFQNQQNFSFGQGTGSRFRVRSPQQATPQQATPQQVAPQQATPQPTNTVATRRASKAYLELHRLANYLQGLHNEPILAKKLRIATEAATLTHLPNPNSRVATRSSSKLFLRIASDIRNLNKSQLEGVGDLIEVMGLDLMTIKG